MKMLKASKGTTLKKIECIVWELTLRCNAKCIHCGSFAGQPRNNELTIDEIFNIIDQLTELNCSNINLLGGEIFLHPQWKDIINYLSHKNFNVSIITNGSYLTPENLGFLKDSNVKNIGISLDGGISQTHDQMRNLPGNYNQIIDNIRHSQQKEMNISIITTVSKFNIKELYFLKELLLKENVKLWQIQTASSHQCGKDYLSLDDFEYYVAGLFFARERKRIDKNVLAIVCNHDFGYFSGTIPRHTLHNNWSGCPAGLTTFGIRSNGKVQGCLSLAYENFIEGDLKTESIQEIVEKPTFCHWNKAEVKLNTLNDFCQICIHKDLCKAGCSDVAYSKTNSTGNNPQCYFRIESMLENLEPQNDFEWLFKQLSQSKMDEKGNIYLNSNALLTDNLIQSININDNQKELLHQLCV